MTDTSPTSSHAEHSPNELLARLNIMETMIEEGRRRTHYFGWAFVLWGVADLIAMGWSSLPNYHPALAWSVTMVAAALISIAGRRVKMRGQAATHLGRSISALWIATGTALFIYCFSVPTAGHFELHGFMSTVAVLTGAANFASAIILRWRVQFAVALLWLGSACAVCFVPPTAVFSILMVDLLLGQIGFGLYLMYCEHHDRQGSVAHA